MLKRNPRNFGMLLDGFPGKKSNISVPIDVNVNDLNDYFTHIGHEVSSKYSTNCKMPWKGPESIYSFTFSPISDSSVEYCLADLPKASTLDLFGIDTKLLIIGATIIGPSLTHILNLSLKSSSGF